MVLPSNNELKMMLKSNQNDNKKWTALIIVCWNRKDWWFRLLFCFYFFSLGTCFFLCIWIIWCVVPRLSALLFYIIIWPKQRLYETAGKISKRKVSKEFQTIKCVKFFLPFASFASDRLLATNDTKRKTRN